jgi:hypothetical protein
MYSTGLEPVTYSLEGYCSNQLSQEYKKKIIFFTALVTKKKKAWIKKK